MFTRVSSDASVKQTIVEDYGSTCPQGYKRFNSTHCQGNWLIYYFFYGYVISDSSIDSSLYLIVFLSFHYLRTAKLLLSRSAMGVKLGKANRR